MLCQLLLHSKMDQSYIYIYIYISPPFWTSFLFRSPRCIKQSSLCYTVCSHQLSILYIVSIVYRCQPQSPNSSHPHFPPWYPYICLSGWILILLCTSDFFLPPPPPPFFLFLTWNVSNCYPMPVLSLYVGQHNLFLQFHRFTDGEKLCPPKFYLIEYTQSLICT